MTGGCGLRAPLHAFWRLVDLKFAWRALLRNDALDGMTMFRAWDAFTAEERSGHWRCACAALMAGEVRAATFKAVADPETEGDVRKSEILAAVKVQLTAIGIVEERMTVGERVAMADLMIDTWSRFRDAAVDEQPARGAVEPLAEGR